MGEDWKKWAYIYGAVGILSFIIGRTFIDRDPLSFEEFAQFSRKEALSGFLLAALLIGVSSLLIHITGNVNWVDIRPEEFPFSALPILVLLALSEELIFRAYLLKNLSQSFSTNLSIGISAAIFTGFHLSNPEINPVGICNLFLGGWLMGLTYIYNRNISFPLFFHLTWNIYQAPILGFPVSGISFPSLLVQERSSRELINGGGFGLEGSLIQTLILFIAIICLTLFYHKTSSGNSEPVKKTY